MAGTHRTLRRNSFHQTQTSLILGIIVWGSITSDHRMPLEHMDGRLTEDRFVTKVVEPAVLPLLRVHLTRHIKIMFDPSSFANPTPLAHADTSRDVLPREGTSQAECHTT
ncbi:hypothetical protein TNCV_4510621 [Trichonephila clavipes]|nr:hypothetical protein TNCV_4510621 [Trichonephila clavipes]